MSDLTRRTAEVLTEWLEACGYDPSSVATVTFTRDIHGEITGGEQRAHEGSSLRWTRPPAARLGSGGGVPDGEGDEA